jgi:5'-phosphate synthase pdxT subunit
MKIGVLAVQGDFEAHAQMLGRLGVEPVFVKKTAQVRDLAGLILPGGESTTCLKFLGRDGFGEAIRQAAAAGMPMLGTCAGAILMARRVENPEQESLGLLEVTVRRNAYGSQLDSFIATGEFGGAPLEMVFIRAPQFADLGPGVEVLAHCRGQVVLVRQGHLLAGAFHPELTADLRVHRYFLQMVEEGSLARTR